MLWPDASLAPAMPVINMMEKGLRPRAGRENMANDTSEISSITTAHTKANPAVKFPRALPENRPDFSACLNAGRAETAGSGNNLPVKPVFLGRVTRQTPTVSHLLVQGPYREACWDILAEKVNADKPFTKIPEGEAIHMDPETHEILWGRQIDSQPSAGPDALPVKPAPAAPENPPRIDSLDGAAARFMGTAYERMNCYELVVAGLETMGVRYRGREGLGRHLISQALDRGMAMNRHLTGEGLTRAIGRNLHVVTLNSVSRVDTAVDRAMGALSEKLEPGQILSFSTPTGGHTGIVSRRENSWTFINAGVMDNPVDGDSGGKCVGEEHLAAEIRNWVARAQRQKSGLQITLGSPDPDKLARFQPGKAPRISLRA